MLVKIKKLWKHMTKEIKNTTNLTPVNILVYILPDVSLAVGLQN